VRSDFPRPNMEEVRNDPAPGFAEIDAAFDPDDRVPIRLPRVTRASPARTDERSEFSAELPVQRRAHVEHPRAGKKIDADVRRRDRAIRSGQRPDRRLDV